MILGFGVHCCRWDPDCRALPDPPDRLHLNTPAGSMILCLSRGSWIQGWLPFRGYLNSWWPAAWHPKIGRRQPAHRREE